MFDTGQLGGRSTFLTGRYGNHNTLVLYMFYFIALPGHHNEIRSVVLISDNIIYNQGLSRIFVFPRKVITAKLPLCPTINNIQYRIRSLSMQAIFTLGMMPPQPSYTTDTPGTHGKHTHTFSASRPARSYPY